MAPATVPQAHSTDNNLMLSHGIVFVIGLGLGFGVAAGLRPFLPVLLAGGLARLSALGMAFSPGSYSFLQAGWWLIAAAACLLIVYVLQLRVGSERFDQGAPAAALAGIGVGVGALMLAGSLSAQHDLAWPGLIGGALAAVIAQAAVRPIVLRARRRLPDKSSKQALTLYLDLASLIVAGLVALVHPLGYVVVLLFAWLALAGRRRSGARYAGLRILSR